MQTIGPTRYSCVCGHRWLTGAAEWDHLDRWNRAQQIRATLVEAVFFSLLAAIPAALVYLVLMQWQGAEIAAAVIIVLPFVLLPGYFGLEVAVSIWRTRFQKPKKPGWLN